MPRRRPKKKKRSRNKLKMATRRRKSKRSLIPLNTLRTARTGSRLKEMLEETLTRTNFRGLTELTTLERHLKPEEYRMEFL
jgi:hypothetical protein